MPDANLSDRAPPTIDELVRGDLLELLFRQSWVAVGGGFATAALLASLLWSSASHGLILGWLALQALFIALRIALFSAWARAPLVERVPERWERRYWITLLLSIGCWGLGALLIVPADSLLHQAFTLLILVGMAGGAVSMYSAHRGIALAAVGLMLAPFTLWLLVQGSVVHIGLALAAMLFQFSAVLSTRELSGALERSFRLGHEMKAARDLVAEAVRTDELTGVRSRRAFLERAEQLVHYCQRNRRGLCALVLDLDHFKQVNDTHGHQAGDKVLRELGALLQATFRKADACGRMGGEEFAALLVDTTPETALQVAESLRAGIAELVIDVGDAKFLSVTASIGVAIASAEPYDLETLLHQADAAMYSAKAAGRNRVCSFDK